MAHGNPGVSRGMPTGESVASTGFLARAAGASSDGNVVELPVHAVMTVVPWLCPSPT